MPPHASVLPLLALVDTFESTQAMLLAAEKHAAELGDFMARFFESVAQNLSGQLSMTEYDALLDALDRPPADWRQIFTQPPRDWKHAVTLLQQEAQAKEKRARELKQEDLLFDSLVLPGCEVDPARDEDRALLEAVDELPEAECRKHQLSLIKRFAKASAKVTVAVMPCGAGKTLALMADALYQAKLQPQLKIFVCVPRAVNKAVASVTLGKAQDDLHKAGPGIFVVTYQDRFGLADDVVKGSVLILDEFHVFMKDSRALRALEQHSKVHSVSATLGGPAGCKRLRDSFGERQITFDVVEGSVEAQAKAQQPLIHLEAQPVALKGGTGRLPVLQAACQAVKTQRAAGKQVLVFLRNYLECEDLQKQLAQAHINAKLLDERKDAVWKTIAMLREIEAGVATQPNVVLTTAAASTGLNVFAQCHVVFTDKPKDQTDFLQALGRSNRRQYNGIQEGTWLAGPGEY